jgi:hypothetical protein
VLLERGEATRWEHLSAHDAVRLLAASTTEGELTQDAGRLAAAHAALTAAGGYRLRVRRPPEGLEALRRIAAAAGMA